MERELYIKTGIEKIQHRFLSGELVLRKEGDKSILFGNTHERYRIFQLSLTPLATCLFELIRDGESFSTLYEALNQLEENEPLQHLSNLIDIASFDRNSNTINYGVISEKLSAPINITWDITNTCNLACSYCYNSSGPVKDDSLPLEKCLEIVDEIADLGIYNVWIGGGEPLMKKGIDKILRKFKERKVKVLLATNGILLKNKKILELVSETCTEVNISIDGHTEEIHSFLRGKSAKLSDAIEAVSTLKNQLGSNIYVTAISVVNKHNLKFVPDIIDLCASIGCDKWTHNELYAMGRGNLLKKYVMAHKEYDDFYEIVTKKKSELIGKMVVEDYVRMHKLHEANQVQSFYGCVAGNQEIAIQHRGDVYPCQKLQYDKYHCGNLTKTSLTEIWTQSHILNWLRKRNIEQTECSGCKIFSSGQCNGGCLAEKEIHFERHDTRDPLCPENRDIYKDILINNAIYPYLSKEIKEKIGN